MKPISDDEFELSTGTRFYAHRLMLSIGRTDSGFEFGYGADGSIALDSHDYYNEKDYFTLDEQKEVAKYALKMWQEFINAIEIKEDENLNGSKVQAKPLRAVVAKLTKP